MGFVSQPVKLLNPDGEFVSGKGTLYRQAFAAPAAPANTGIHAAVALTVAVQTVTTSITNPAIPRTVRVKGNASGNAGNVVVNGTDQFGDVISETIALNGASAVDGLKAFRTVTSFTLPAETHSGTDTVSLGPGAALGLERHIAEASAIYASVDTAPDSALPTMGVTYDTVLFATATNGTKNFVVGFVHIDLENA